MAKHSTGRGHKTVNVPTSRLFFTRKLSLNTVQAKRVYMRCYTELSRFQHSITVIAQFIGNQEAASLAEAQVQEYFTQAHNTLKQEYDRVELIRKQNGITEMPHSDNPGQLMAQIKSPLDARFLDLIVLLDELVMKIGSLWLHSLIDSTVNKDMSYRCQQTLIKCHGRVISTASRLRGMANKRNLLTDEVKKQLDGGAKTPAAVSPPPEPVPAAIAAVQLPPKSLKPEAAASAKAPESGKSATSKAPRRREKTAATA